MIRTFKKQSANNAFVGGMRIAKKTLTSLSVALVVSIFFVVWFAIVNYHGYWDYLDFPGYMWYVLCLVLTELVYYLLWRGIANKKIFYWLMFAIFTACTLLFYKNLGIFRCFGGISLGILLSIVPKIVIPNKNIQKFVVYAGAVISLTACVILASAPDKTLLLKLILCFVSFSLLIFFCSQIVVKSTVTNKILCFCGSLSFGFYAYQCVLRVLRFYNLTNTTILFCILIVITLLDRFLIKGKILLRKEKRSSNAISE